MYNKKAILRRLITTLIIVLLGGIMLTAYNAWRKYAYETLRFAQKLAPGINLGNSLDVYNISSWLPNASIEDYQLAWGNPLITRKQLAQIRSAGFVTVRIPVSWGEHMNEHAQIDPAFMARVRQVVDDALAEGLYVILNTHHESWLSAMPSHEQAVTQIFTTIWQQIAREFALYDTRLLFEGLNEPRTRDTENEWKGGTKPEREVINRLNLAFVQTVRNSGDGNANRYLLVTPYAADTSADAINDFVLPLDKRLIVSIHAYKPFSFAQKEDGTAQWDSLAEEDTKQIDEIFERLENSFIKKRIPVMLTELGCTDKQNDQARISWATYHKSKSIKAGIPLFWWDDGKDYRLLNRQDGGWHFKDIMQILTASEK